MPKSPICAGGTSFDTPTCIGGNIEFPFNQQGNQSTKIYRHHMLVSQDAYSTLPQNSTLTSATSKPLRSPFPDDPAAYFVADQNPAAAGNGLMRFDRIFANIPLDYDEPYGLYAKELPSSSTSVESDAFNHLQASIEILTVGADDDDIFKRKYNAYKNNTPSSNNWNINIIRTGYGSVIDGSQAVRWEMRVTSDSPAMTDIIKNTHLGDSVNVVPNSSYNYFMLKWRNGGFDDLFTFNIPTTGTVTGVDSTNGDYMVVNLGVDWTLTNFLRTQDPSTKPLMSIWAGRIVSYHNFGFETEGATTFTGSRSRTTTISDPQLTNLPSRIRYRFIKTDSPDTISLTAAASDNDYINAGVGTFLNAENEFVERWIGNIYRIGTIQARTAGNPSSTP